MVTFNPDQWLPRASAQDRIRLTAFSLFSLLLIIINLIIQILKRKIFTEKRWTFLKILLLENFYEFVDTWIKDITDQYHLYIKEKNSAELYRIAHTIKGSCYQFGFK